MKDSWLDHWLWDVFDALWNLALMALMMWWVWHDYQGHAIFWGCCYLGLLVNLECKAIKSRIARIR